MSIEVKLKRQLCGAALALVMICFAPFAVEDAFTYHEVTTGSFKCCGFVSESVLKRPVTYALVDEWTEPAWTENAIKSERWLVSNGMVNGEMKFWRILDRAPIEQGATSPGL